MPLIVASPVSVRLDLGTPAASAVVCVASWWGLSPLSSLKTDCEAASVSVSVSRTWQDHCTRILEPEALIYSHIAGRSSAVAVVIDLRCRALANSCC